MSPRVIPEILSISRNRETVQIPVPNQWMKTPILRLPTLRAMYLARIGRNVAVSLVRVMSVGGRKSSAMAKIRVRTARSILMVSTMLFAE